MRRSPHTLHLFQVAAVAPFLGCFFFFLPFGCTFSDNSSLLKANRQILYNENRMAPCGYITLSLHCVYLTSMKQNKHETKKMVSLSTFISFFNMLHKA